MGMIIGYVKYSCNRCKKYGIQSISSLYFPLSQIKETNCPFCQNEIEKSKPTQLEISTFHNEIKGGIVKVLTLKDILVFHMADENK